MQPGTRSELKKDDIAIFKNPRWPTAAIIKYQQISCNTKSKHVRLISVSKTMFSWVKNTKLKLTGVPQIQNGRQIQDGRLLDLQLTSSSTNNHTLIYE